MKTPPNNNEFPTIKGARQAMESLENLISDIKNEIERAKSDESTIGWDDDGNFGQFIHQSTSHDPEFMRKLVNLGLCL